jgi:hypothetical protein
MGILASAAPVWAAQAEARRAAVARRLLELDVQAAPKQLAQVPMQFSLGTRKVVGFNGSGWNRSERLLLTGKGVILHSKGKLWAQGKEHKATLNERLTPQDLRRVLTEGPEMIMPNGKPLTVEMIDTLIPTLQRAAQIELDTKPSSRSQTASRLAAQVDPARNMLEQMPFQISLGKRFVQNNNGTAWDRHERLLLTGRGVILASNGILKPYGKTQKLREVLTGDALIRVLTEGPEMIIANGKPLDAVTIDHLMTVIALGRLATRTVDPTVSLKPIRQWVESPPE